MQRLWALIAVLVCYFIQLSKSAAIREHSKAEQEELLRTLEKLDRLLSKAETEEPQYDNAERYNEDYYNERYLQLGDGPVPYKRAQDGSYKRMLGDGPAPYKRWGDDVYPDMLWMRFGFSDVVHVPATEPSLQATPDGTEQQHAGSEESIGAALKDLLRQLQKERLQKRAGETKEERGKRPPPWAANPFPNRGVNHNEGRP